MCLYFVLRKKQKCYAAVSMSLTFVCFPAYVHNHIVTFIKLGTYDVYLQNTMTKALKIHLAFINNNNTIFLRTSKIKYTTLWTHNVQLYTVLSFRFCFKFYNTKFSCHIHIC